MINIPATAEGVEAIAEASATGSGVNITPLFGIDICRDVIRVSLSGPEQAELVGHDISTIYLVASFFVSRVDAEDDARLGEPDTPAAAELHGTVAVANTCLAYRVFQEKSSSIRAPPPRPRRSPATAIVGLHRGEGPGSARHVLGERIHRSGHREHDAPAEDTPTRLKAVGISCENVTNKLLKESVDKFAPPCNNATTPSPQRSTAATPPRRPRPGLAKSGRRKNDRQ